MNDSKFSHDNYNILIEFAHAHLEFQRPELECVLSIHGIKIGRDCVEISLPSPAEAVRNSRPFLILSFDYEYTKKKFNLDDEGEILSSDISRYSTINKENPTIASVLSRCTLIRSVTELWGTGKCFDSCADHVRSLSQGIAGKELLAKCMKPSSSWKITIHTLGTRVSREEQNEMRKTFSFLDFPGKVQMVDPTNEFLVIREIELDSKGTPLEALDHQKRDNSTPPIGVYYGRILGGLRNWRGGNRLEQYSLKKRSYLGPTSMDAELSLIMTNFGLVQKGFMCFEPFVGTGSILLTCGLRGGYSIGTDIDIRVLRGRSDGENVLTNFDQYKLHRPDLVRSDNALYHRHYRTSKPLYDAIITDPPYGIRAGARKTGSKLEEPRSIPEENRHDHIAQTKVYAVSDVMGDLLDVASKTLVMGGRLVYIIPSMTGFDVETDLPRHDCLKLLYVCYQPLQTELGRRVVVMEKVEEYDSSQRDRYLSNIWVNGPESAEKCANIRERLIEAARLKPGYEEKAAYRKKKRQETKEAKKKAKREANELAGTAAGQTS
jgi:tRNA (guanine10-N2)-methyltransferase